MFSGIRQPELACKFRVWDQTFFHTKNPNEQLKEY